MRSAQIRQVIEDYELQEHAELILARARPALRLRTRLVENQDLPPGKSRMGGDPDLPPATPWPENQDRPIEFLAQIDLAEATRACPLPGLPSTGWLCVFCDFQALHNRTSLDERCWWLTYFDCDVGALRPAAHPGDPVEQLNLCTVDIECEDSVPDVAAILSGHPDGEDWDICRSLNESINEAWDFNPVHRLGGYPVLIQSQGGSGSPSGWDFLLQIDSDQDVGVMWGDMGRVYFWITPQDLAARRFEAAWGSNQCY
jgi:uncharacterized protein YwqG